MKSCLWGIERPDFIFVRNKLFEFFNKSKKTQLSKTY